MLDAEQCRCQRDRACVLLRLPCMWDLAEKVAFLRSIGTFDGVVDCIETHMSFVFLTERRAFKLKKPVCLPHLDHRTLAKRKQSCDSELRLGRRLAGDVYEQVAPLVAGPDGLQIGGEGEVVDWLVVMRRLDHERMLPAMFERGRATLAHADAVATRLVEFYRESARAIWTGARYRQRIREQLVDTGGELVARGAPREQVDAIVRPQLGYVEHAREVLDARITEGRVVEAHGDLRPEHVCLEDPPVIIDPLEFDQDLRTLDAVSELAFFSLECERLGAAWFGARVLAVYRAQTGDRPSPDLVALYRAQHALTRALLALRHLDDAKPSEHGRWRARAAYYLRAMDPPTARQSTRRDEAR